MSGAISAISERAGPSAACEQRADRREIQADRRARRASELDRPASGEPEWFVEQGIDRQVDGIGACEPGWLQVGRPELQCGGAILDEAAFAIGCDEDPDPARPRAGDPDHVRRDAITPDRATSARPAASRPTAATNADRAPSRPSHLAAFDAEPPWVTRSGRARRTRARGVDRDEARRRP